jgi:patatin-related protein
VSERQDAAVTEIRLGLVCYGGVSLAVYMYGVTKEIFTMVRASRAREAGGPAPAGSGAAYVAALQEVAAQGSPRTVVVDAVSGTSAGGINGVCLARGLAEGRDLDKFRSLWIEQGNIWTLITGSEPSGSGALRRILGALRGLPARVANGVLDGDHMSRLVFRALQDMTALTDPPGAVAADVDLFVTTTDVHGYDVAVTTGAGGVSAIDRSYRQVLAFHSSTELPPAPAGTTVPTVSPGDGFGDEALPALAFAARATSSFPGAFPAVSVESFAEDVRSCADPSPDEQARIARHFVYGEGDGHAAAAWYMDGGVLDNAPFDHLLDAIAAKRAETLVAREIVYVEPDPQRVETGPEERRAEPSAAELLVAARGTIPTHTSLVEVLERLREMNEGIGAVGAIVAVEESAVGRELTEANLLSTDDLSYGTVARQAALAREIAAARAGVGYPGYAVLRLQAIGDLLAGPICRSHGYPPHSTPAVLVRGALRAWTGVDMAETLRTADPDALAAVVEDDLGAIDLPYRIRRAQFLIRQLNHLLADEREADRREQLATMKTACWNHLEQLRRAAEDLTQPVRGAATAVFGPDALRERDRSDPAAFAAARTSEIRAVFRAYRAAAAGEVVGSSRTLWETFQQNTKGWPAAEAARVLSPYVGFPIWDAAIFPVIALAELPQLTPMGVTRFSPLDACALRAPAPDRPWWRRWPWSQPPVGSGRKLQGVPLHHFGAFFSHAARENDYLWGRLDGAELLLRLLSKRSGGVDLGDHLRTALTAILDAEAGPLRTTKDLVAALRSQLAAPDTTMPSRCPEGLG